MDLDRHGRDVYRDRFGRRYVLDDGFPFYITECCDASVTGSEGVTACRNCYTEVDPLLGGNPTGCFGCSLGNWTKGLNGAMIQDHEVDCSEIPPPGHDEPF